MFRFADGQVQYQNRFLESQSYQRDTRAQAIVGRHFATQGRPDPCRTIMRNLRSKLVLSEQFTDNCQISVYPYGDGLYALTETPYAYRVDPTNLHTGEKVDLTQHLSVVSHTAHPHVTRTCTYNIGQGVTLTGPRYNICQFPRTGPQGQASDPFKAAKIVASVACRWRTSPCYMH
ncbi:carotenoid isomerooxygenase-like [Hyalella azteca]|uniref:Carotenoid isomerooxygenase-like n=1 Tax=Hyalella azteca TaxID=294128 RepID=A0A979FFL4_HYAAZ|nr:carotenoid isomerooxygenase-like [Hyalella azteca]